MGWEDLYSTILSEYDYLNRINAATTSSSGEIHDSFPVHKILKYTTSLLLNSIRNNEGLRLAIVLPNKNDIPAWLAALSTIQIIKDDFKRNTSPENVFVKGQKLLVRGEQQKCIVEYDGEEYNHEAQTFMMHVKCSQFARISLPLNRKLRFEPSDSMRPLSPPKKVVMLLKEPAINNQIDGILGIKTFGNRTLFNDNIIFVSKIGTSENFISSTYMNGSKISDLFSWGKISVDGDVNMLGSNQIVANPSCLVAADLYSVSQYLTQKFRNVKGVLLDGSGSFIDNLQLLDDDILDKKIPVVAILDHFDTEHTDHLINRDFKIWQWNKERIKQSQCIERSPWHSPFSNIDTSINNHCSQSILTNSCQSESLNDVIDLMHKLSRELSDADQPLKVIHSKLIRLVNSISRTIEVPSETQISSWQTLIFYLKEQYNEHGMWLSKDIRELINETLDKLLEISDSLFDGNENKVSVLKDVLKGIPFDSKTAIIVQSEDSRAITARYWESKLDSHVFKQLSFITSNECLNHQSDSMPASAILCGWLGNKKMYKIIHSNVFSEVNMLMYPFEGKWHRSAANSWGKQNNYKMSSDNLSEILKLPSKNLIFLEQSNVEHADNVSKGHEDVFRYEDALTTFRYAQYAVNNTHAGDVVIAKLILFNQNKYAFLSETHRLIVLTDLLKGKVSHNDVPRRSIKGILPGDYVLFRDSDRDLIKDAADKVLISQNMIHLRRLSNIWKVALEDLYVSSSSNIERVVDVLRGYNCGRTSVTVRSWIFNDSTIGPMLQSDLEAIAQATGNIELQTKLDEVWSAILVVRRAHKKAARALQEQLLANIQGILDEHGDLNDIVEMELDDFGIITILKIEEVSNEWQEIEARHVGRLLTLSN